MKFFKVIQNEAHAQVVCPLQEYDGAFGKLLQEARNPREAWASCAGLFWEQWNCIPYERSVLL